MWLDSATCSSLQLPPLWLKSQRAALKENSICIRDLSLCIAAPLSEMFGNVEGPVFIALPSTSPVTARLVNAARLARSDWLAASRPSHFLGYLVRPRCHISGLWICLIRKRKIMQLLLLFVLVSSGDISSASPRFGGLPTMSVIVDITVFVELQRNKYSSCNQYSSTHSYVTVKHSEA